jgi:serine phosphatase RsbU (regulator of sigma subunit)
LLLVAILYAAWRYSVEQSSRQSALEQEYRSAQEVQRVLIPDTLPTLPGYDLTSAYRPAREVGGDFFQILPLDDPRHGGSTLILLGDVSGKGLKAAMAVSLIVGALRALAEDHPDPADLLAQLNRRLAGRLQGGFATCLALRVASDGQCSVASAGHPAPLINGNEVILPGALPLGLTADAEYASIEFALPTGDHLALYTDGLLEARKPSGELYGFERLGALFAARPGAADAADAAVKFGQDDDITVLTAERLGTSSQSSLLASTSAH